MALSGLLALSVLTFLPSFSQANYSPPICPLPPAPQIFGHPIYNACQTIIRDLRVRDNLLHVFTPIGMRRPTTPDETLGEVTNYAWRNRVNLPIFLGTRGCKLAVLYRTQADGSQGWGMSWYDFLADALGDINDVCVSPAAWGGGNRGGYKRYRTTSGLVVVLYELGSDYDEYVMAELTAGRLPVADGDGVPYESPDPSVQNSFEGELDDTASSGSRGPNAQRVTGRNCGQYCSSFNLCTGGDECKCIADPWQSPGSGYFTGTCKLPYFASGRQLSEIHVNSTNLVNVTGNLNSSASATVSAFNAPSLSGGNSTGLACPCNCTYVSKACCSSDSGTVYEAPNLKLGALHPPNSSMVCDATSGQFQLVG